MNNHLQQLDQNTFESKSARQIDESQYDGAPHKMVPIEKMYRKHGPTTK